jgi:hypothetical protein
MTCRSIATIGLLLGVAYTTALAETVPVDGTQDLPLVMPGYASLTSDFHLNTPDGSGPLMERHIEVISVYGEIDPPFTEGNDKLDLTNPEYNLDRYKNLMNSDPGMVAATMTVFYEEPDSLDNRVQLWERIIVRIYNADIKEEATHYIDSTPWKTQPGFVDITPEMLQFTEWKALSKPENTQDK